MEEESVIVKDPFGKNILLTRELCPGVEENKVHEVYDDLSKVITKPAMVIEINENSRHELYYFRSVNWDETILIKVRRTDDHWESTGCTKNPPTTQISELLQHGRQLL